jgi:hypothetical protein
MSRTGSAERGAMWALARRTAVGLAFVLLAALATPATATNAGPPPGSGPRADGSPAPHCGKDHQPPCPSKSPTGGPTTPAPTGAPTGAPPTTAPPAPTGPVPPVATGTAAGPAAGVPGAPPAASAGAPQLTPAGHVQTAPGPAGSSPGAGVEPAFGNPTQPVAGARAAATGLPTWPALGTVGALVAMLATGLLLVLRGRRVVLRGRRDRAPTATLVPAPIAGPSALPQGDDRPVAAPRGPITLEWTQP